MFHMCQKGMCQKALQSSFVAHCNFTVKKATVFKTLGADAQVICKLINSVKGDLELQIRDLGTRLDTMNGEINNATLLANQAIQNNNVLEGQIQDLKNENMRLKQRVLLQESYSKKYNLKFYNIVETPGETHRDLQSKLHNVLGLLDIDMSRFYIDNFHRLPKEGNGPRPVIVKFISFLDRELVWNSKGRLYGRSNVYIREHHPVEIENNIRRLLPIRRAAKEQGLNVKMHVDKLVVNSSTYTVNNLHQLPENLRPENVACRKEDKFLFFFSGACPLSNFHESKFQVEGVHYINGEQFLQKKKADFFGDRETGNKIMLSKNPREIKALGSQVKDFSEESWQTVAPDTVKEGLHEKFAQNPHLKKFLVETKDLTLVEAAKNDVFWGIGKGLYDKDILQDRKSWGSNYLGCTLMEIRDRLKSS